MRKALVWGLSLGCLLMVSAAGQQRVRKEIRLIDDSDLNCSLLALEEIPRLRIDASERMEERSLLREGDLFAFKRIPGDGLAVGQELNILEIGSSVALKAPGVRPVTAAEQRGRAKIASLDAASGRARIEKACGPIEIGQSLGPLSEGQILLGFDEGFDSLERKKEGPQGEILYLAGQASQIAPGRMALVELGTSQGIHPGQQLVVFRGDQKNALWQAMASVIVVHAGPRVSAVKVLSARDVVRVGDVVQPRDIP